MAGIVIPPAENGLNRKAFPSTPIITANQYPSVTRLGGYRRYVEHHTRARWPMLTQTLRIDWRNTAGEVLAMVIRGSWRAGCPFCNGSVFCEPSEPFFCPDCAMQGNQFRPMRVVMPERRQDIERLLRMRPDPNTRNWIPPETVENLIAENLEHGLMLLGSKS